MAVSRDVIDTRLAKIREAVGVIEKAMAGGTDLAADELRLYAVEHALQVAIESVLDIGSHIIAAENWRRPTEYADIIRVLGQKGVLPPEFTARIVGMAGLRNVLVHEYADVDLDRLSDALARLEDFTAFSDYVLAYLTRRQQRPPSG